MPWRAFVRAHAASMVAADFVTTEVWTARGLVTHYVLFAIDVGTRAVRILGVTPHPNRRFVEAVARALIDPVLGFLSGKSFFVIDRDQKFTAAFREIIEAAGVHVIRTAWRSPNMNAHAERFVRSVKSECLRHFVLVGPGQLERVLREYVAHYNAERHHQGIGNRLITGLPEPESAAKRIATTRRLGGLLNYYHPAAAA